MNIEYGNQLKEDFALYIMHIHYVQLVLLQLHHCDESGSVRVCSGVRYCGVWVKCCRFLRSFQTSYWTRGLAKHCAPLHTLMYFYLVQNSHLGDHSEIKVNDLQ